MEAERPDTEGDTVRMMDPAVADGVANGGVADHVVPVNDRQLAGDERGTAGPRRATRSSTFSRLSRRFRSSSGPLPVVVKRPHALWACPGLEHRGVDREMLAVNQLRGFGQSEGSREQLVRDRPVQQALPILRERRGVSRRALEIKRGQ